tara:strand:- start:20339 stop:20683 length:345 start_codon:yes stop_codon:yes gene_type:complete
MKFLKKISNDILVSKVSLKPIIKNLIKKHAFRLIEVTLYSVVFVLCLILVYKLYNRNRGIQTTNKTYHNEKIVFDSKREYQELSSQIVRLNQSIDNIDLKINKLLLLCDSVSPR